MSETFGKFVKALRIEKGYTIRGFAEKVKLSPTFISRVEKDEVNPPCEEKLIDMAKTLNIDSETLIFKARRIPRELTQLVIDRPYLARLIRLGSTYDNDKLRELINYLNK